jgi:hypothetical protein
MTTTLEERRRTAQRNLDRLRAPGLALDAAEAELATLDAQIAQQEAEQAHQQAIGRLSDLATEGAAALQAAEDAHQAFDAALLPILEAYSAARARQYEARQAFYDALPRGDGALPILAELEAAGVDLQGVLSNLSEHRSKPHDRPYPAPCAFPGALDSALRTEATRRLGYSLPPDAVIISLPERNDP